MCTSPTYTSHLRICTFVSAVYVVIGVYCLGSLMGLYSLCSPFVALIPVLNDYRYSAQCHLVILTRYMYMYVKELFKCESDYTLWDVEYGMDWNTHLQQYKTNNLSEAQLNQTKSLHKKLLYSPEQAHINNINCCRNQKSEKCSPLLRSETIHMTALQLL